MSISVLPESTWKDFAASVLSNSVLATCQDRSFRVHRVSHCSRADGPDLEGFGPRCPEPWTDLARGQPWASIFADRKGNPYVFHQELTAVLVYDQEGKFLQSWADYPAAHGLALVGEGEESPIVVIDACRYSILRASTFDLFGNGFLASPDCFAIDGDTVVIPKLLGRVTVVDADDKLLYNLGENDKTGKDKDP